jgi:type IV secretion system protein VirD4
MLAVLTAASIFLSANLHSLLAVNKLCLTASETFKLMKEKNVLMFFCLFEFLSVSIVIYLSAQSNLKYKSNMQWITPDIQTPMPEGQNQYGSARWLSKNKYTEVFSAIALNSNITIFDALYLCLAAKLNKSNLFSKLNICIKTEKIVLKLKIRELEKKGVEKIDKKQPEQPKNNELISEGGIILGKTNKGNTFFFVNDDTHTLCIGATRSGKSRTVVLPSACLQALAGENMIFSDPKGELFFYLSPFLKRLGYEVITLDFDNPIKSDRYNFLQPIIDYVNQNNVPKAVEATWDIVSCLVGKSTGEPIWHNGECSILACGILAVVYDNKNNPQFQNLTNVYYFLGEMCKANKDGMLPLEIYLRKKPYTHPAKALVHISDVAPSRTKGSFFTSALATLRLFANQNIYQMTCRTDFDIYDGERKRALFIILPDEKSTYYSVASLFCTQHYQLLTSIAKQNGGRLPRRTNYNLDEFGNFTYIPDFAKMLTVGGGRGMRFNLFLQDFCQLNEIYGENVSKTIRGNCETWIYLQSDNPDTLRELSDKLGNYTIKSPSLSSSSSYGGNTNTSASYNYTARKLLEIDEIKRINRPYQLVTSRNNPAVFYSPDISKTIFNKMLGLGDKKHNIELIKTLNAARPVKDTTDGMALWKIWEKYKDKDESEAFDTNPKPATVKAAPKPVSIIKNSQKSLGEM